MLQKTTIMPMHGGLLMNKFSSHSQRTGCAVLWLLSARWLGRLGLALVCGLGCWPHDAIALDPNRSLAQYNLRTWRRVNQLPSNMVNAIVQSNDGHLWLGTPRGLVDFDGVEFKEAGLPGQ